MKRFVISLACLASFVGAGYSFYYFGIRPDYNENVSLWLVFAPGSGLLLLAIALLWWALSDNIHNVESGMVIDRSFTAAHMTAPIHVPGTPGNGTTPGTASIVIPAYEVGDCWSLKLRDKRGRTGWLHFSTNVFADYPIGSRYPKNTKR